MSNAKTIQKTAAPADLALLKRTTVDQVTERVRGLLESKELHLPPNYSAENALKAAWLVLQDVTDKNGKPALSVCTPNSIANSLFSTVVQGLDPIKKQVWFIVRGTDLTAMRSYFGTIAVAKRMAGVRDVYAEAVYAGDTFEYEIQGGVKRITKHVQTLDSIDTDKIVGGYAVVDLADGRVVTEIMNITQIKKSWSAGYANGPQKSQPDEMVRRTLVNRALKRYINSSTDEHLGVFIEHFNRTDVDAAEENLESEARETANTELLAIDDGKTIDVDAETGEIIDEDVADDSDEQGGIFEQQAAAPF